RISVIPIELPPLRDRAEDIPELVHHFLGHRQSSTSEVPKIVDAAMEVLMNHQWPGNVRELENAIERAVALCDNSLIEVKDLPPRVLEAVQKCEVKYKFVPKTKTEPVIESAGLVEGSTSEARGIAVAAAPAKGN